MGDGDPSGGAFDCRLEVLCEPAASAEPGEGAFYDPATRQDLEALRLAGSLDDRELPCADPAQRVPELWPSIAAIGKDAPQPGIE
jgi:hypothetical protein